MDYRAPGGAGPAQPSTATGDDPAGSADWSGDAGGPRMGRRESLFSTSNPGEGKKGRNFKVVVRVRPMVERERDYERCVVVESKHSIRVNKSDDGVGFSRPTTARERRPSLVSQKRPSTATASRSEDQQFAYDRVFDDNVEQEDIYEQACRPIVHSVLEGYNGTVLAYGQTGTGKTYTMEGTVTGNNRGVIPRAAADIFDYIEADKPGSAADDGSDSQWLVRCSFCQIYNEKISDLLKPESNDLKIRETGSKDTYVEDLSEEVVRGPGDIYKVLARGRTQRNTNSTKMNATSSRSHAVFTIIVEHGRQNPELPNVNDVTIGKLHLVDLAGSERYGVTEIEKHQKETVEINRSLSAFGKVVLALTSRGTQHIPYRDSKLTRILQTSLGGNSLTTMITTVSPMAVSILETVTTLKFANRAKSVKNVAQVNHGSDESAMLSNMQAEIRRLQAALERQSFPQTVTNVEVELELQKLKEDSKKSALEKAAIKEDLLKHQAAVAAAQRERQKYEDQITALRNQVVAGGTAIEETDAFKTAVAKERTRLKEEHDSRKNEVEQERRRLELEKAAFEEERRKFKQSAAKLLGAGSPPSTPLVVPKRPNRPTLGSPITGSPVTRPRPPLGRPQSQLSPRYSGGDGRPTLTAKDGSSSTNAVPVHSPTSGAPPVVDQHQDIPPVSPQATELIEDNKSHGYSPPASGNSSRRGSAKWNDANDVSSDESEEIESVEKPRRLLNRQSSAPVLRRNSAGSRSGHEHESAGLDRVGDARDHTHTAEDDRIEQYARMLQHPATGIPLGTRRIRLSNYKLCFSGADAVGWFLAHLEGVDTTQDAVAMGQQMIDLGIFSHVKNGRQFIMSDAELYQFRKLDQRGNLVRPGSAASTMSRRSSTSSLGGWSSRLSMSSAHSGSSLSLVSRSSRFAGNGGSDDYQDKNCSPLHLAAAKGDVAGIRILIQEVNIDIIDSSGRTPLMYATISNRARMCRFLVKNGADVNIRDDLGNSCLIWAACRGCRDSMKELLKLGSDIAAVDAQGRSAIHWATKLRRVDCLDYLLRCAFRVAVNLKDEENLTALHWATMCDHEQHVQALLNAQAEITIGDSEGRTAFHYAVSRNALTCLAKFIEFCRGAINVPDANGRTALHAACAEGSTDATALLLNTPGIEINSTDARLTTPLHWAAVCNRPELCAMLLEQGARLMARDKAGKTPLHYATEKGFMDCANIMQRFSSTQSHRERTSLRDPVPSHSLLYERRSSVSDRKVPSRSDKWSRSPGFDK